MRLLSESLAGIVLVSPRYEHAIPGKLFDVLSAGRPVLYIGPGDADAARTVLGHRLGWCHEPDDIGGLAASLQAAGQGRFPTPIDAQELQTEEVSHRLDAELRALLAR